MDRLVNHAAARAASERLRWRSAMLLAGLALAAAIAWQPAHAQFSVVPDPVAQAVERMSMADSDRGYRPDGARHLYASYPGHIHKGKLPPLMYAVANTETEIDEAGRVVNAVMVREPAAAKEVTPWVLEMIRRASPFPKPARMGHVKYLDIWLVDKSGKFQLDTLTEGQR
jgi:protein TonB